MAATDRRIDAYIQKAPEYAQPILKHIRKVVHDACPDVQETLKWRSPSFEYRGLLCGMAAFKRCALLGFWKSKVLVDRGFAEVGRLTSVADLPSDAELLQMIKAAMLLNEQGIKLERPKAARKPPVKPPAYFLAAVKQNRKALTHFEAFSPSHQREYVEWVTEARGEDTRERRLTQAVAWIAEGKSRNWKYE